MLQYLHLSKSKLNSKCLTSKSLNFHKIQRVNVCIMQKVFLLKRSFEVRQMSEFLDAYLTNYPVDVVSHEYATRGGIGEGVLIPYRRRINRDFFCFLFGNVSKNLRRFQLFNKWGKGLTS